MKLSDYARREGVRYETAWRWYRDGKIKGHRVGKHTIMIDEDASAVVVSQKVAVYARVSSAENTSNLESQAKRLVAYSMAKGYQIAKIVKEVGSGVNDARPKFLALLEDPSITVIVVEHKDRASRFGVRYIESLLRLQGRQLEIVNQAENGTEDLLADLTSIVYSFCARLYGQRMAKRKTEKIVEQLEGKEEQDATG
ncbi:MAG: IS607 family transposase [Ktedonobacteraceae bacterium]